MRLWSLHPKYLDGPGLVALWREGLLARQVLAGRTRGYRSHPQLERFRSTRRPLIALDAYLWTVFAESVRRGYRFDRSKLGRRMRPGKRMTVTDGQLRYELRHLLSKLRKRAPALFARWRSLSTPRVNPVFMIKRGGIASWERIPFSPRPGPEPAVDAEGDP